MYGDNVTVWIHGAKSSSVAMNYLQSYNTGENLLIDYTVTNGLYHAITQISKTIRSYTDRPVNIVGHSLGGVISTLLTKTSLPIAKIVTISAPFGGTSNFVIKKASAYGLIQRDVISIQRRIPLSKPVVTSALHLVTTKGFNYSDGVISIDSQTALPVEYQYIDFTHHSVLKSPLVASKIKWFLS